MNQRNMRILIITIFVSILCLICCSCSASGDKLVGKWKTGDEVIEFTADGRFLSMESNEQPNYYDVLSGGIVSIYTEGAPEEGVKLKFSFKSDNLFLGKLKYTPVKE